MKWGKLFFSIEKIFLPVIKTKIIKIIKIVYVKFIQKIFCRWLDINLYAVR